MWMCIATFLFCQPIPCLPLASFNFPFLTNLEIPLLLLVVGILIHSCPWLAINCSPIAA
jgi:hypothetical protein